jgi:hypothetical protein
MVDAMRGASFPAFLRLQPSGASASVTNSAEQHQRSARRRSRENAFVI